MKSKAENLKIRCSSLGHIMSFDTSTKITEKQLETIAKYEKKDKLTENQSAELERLRKKRDAPPALSTGAKTNLKDIFYSRKFDFNKTFTNKFTEKGNIMENRAIDQVVKFLELPMVIKNEKHFSNDRLQGTPDMVVKPLDFQCDVKNVYYPHNLDHFDELDSLYKWQGNGYNILTETRYSVVAKILLNPPDHILEKEVYNMAKEAGIHYTDITDSFRKEVKDYFDFEGKMPLHERINLYTFETTGEDIKQINTAVDLAREYFSELEQTWKSKNKKEVEFIKSLT